MPFMPGYREGRWRYAGHLSQCNPEPLVQLSADPLYCFFDGFFAEGFFSVLQVNGDGVGCGVRFFVVVYIEEVDRLQQFATRLSDHAFNSRISHARRDLEA